MVTMHAVCHSGWSLGNRPPAASGTLLSSSEPSLFVLEHGVSQLNAGSLVAGTADIHILLHELFMLSYSSPKQGATSVSPALPGSFALTTFHGQRLIMNKQFPLSFPHIGRDATGCCIMNQFGDCCDLMMLLFSRE